MVLGMGASERRVVEEKGRSKWGKRRRGLLTPRPGRGKRRAQSSQIKGAPKTQVIDRTWGTRERRGTQDPGGMTGRGENERDYSRWRMRSAADLAAFLISATLWAAGSESCRRSARMSAWALITQRRLLRLWEMASMRLAGKRLSWRGSMTGAIWEPSL